MKLLVNESFLFDNSSYLKSTI